MLSRFSRVRLFGTPWTIVRQAPLSMEFIRQEFWSGLPLPSPGDLPDPGIELGSPTLQENSLPSEPPGKPYKVLYVSYYSITSLESYNNLERWRKGGICSAYTRNMMWAIICDGTHWGVQWRPQDPI